MEQASQQLSQIEKSVTHLLIATKQLLETLTMWSRHSASESEVSDVYVRLGYEFNIACRAFAAIGVETNDLGPVPDLLRSILEDTLSQDASPQSLDKFLPRIRDIIINLLHGLKRKQQRLRAKQEKDGKSSTGSLTQRQLSNSSFGSADTGLTDILADVPSSKFSNRTPERRNGSTTTGPLADEPGVPPRTSSMQSILTSPTHEEAGMDFFEQPSKATHHARSFQPSTSNSSMSSATMQDIPVLSPDDYKLPIQQMPIQEPQQASGEHNTSGRPPPPPPKQQDALAALQRGGDLERRASRRYSAYQISKHLGASPSGVPVIPPAQNSPVPNRSRDVRESLHAVRTRGSLVPSRQRSANRYGEHSPSRAKFNPSRRISEETSGGEVDSRQSHVRAIEGENLVVNSPADHLSPSYPAVAATELLGPAATLNGPLDNGFNGLPHYHTGYIEDREEQKASSITSPRVEDNGVTSKEAPQVGSESPSQSDQFIPEQSPQPGKELVLFLQYKSKIKKFVLPDGSNELSLARLQLAFIEKFAWNTHNNGNDLPEIYVQDPISGVRHELEDLGDIKDRSVLVLNIEALDEVKRHIDEGLGGLRRMVEGVRTVVDGQQTAIQQVSNRQQDTVKEVARMMVVPPSTHPRSGPFGKNLTNNTKASLAPAEVSSQVSDVHSLRRDLAVVRQTLTSFTVGINASMEEIRSKASAVKALAIDATAPKIDEDSGRAYLNNGKRTVGEESETIVNHVDDLQDLVEELRKDVVTRGVRPLPRQLETVSKDISMATAKLKKMQEFLKREKPVWSKIWATELDVICQDREFLTMQEGLCADLEDDLDEATRTFALVEEATKQQNLQSTSGNNVTLRNVSRGIIPDQGVVDPMKVKDGVLGEIRALQPSHETRLEAIQRAEKARQLELESRREGEFKKELGNFVEEGKLKKSGGVEEADRLRKLKDAKNRREGWENQVARQTTRDNETERSSSNNEPTFSDMPAIEEEQLPQATAGELPDSYRKNL